MAELFRVKAGDGSIEANKVTKETVSAVALWCGGVEVVEHDALQHDVTFAAINVPTVTGMVRAQEGDWIIKRPTGGFFPLSESRFTELFEPIS